MDKTTQRTASHLVVTKMNKELVGKIKLVNPPFTRSLDDKIDPPLGLLYIAAVLEEAKYPVEILDLPLIPRNKWSEAIGKPDIVGITVMAATIHEAKEVLRIAKLNNPKAIVVAGGPHTSALPEETLKEGFDAVVVGEGEYTFLSLVQKVYAGKPFDKVIVSSPVDVNRLPFPARHLINLKDYTRKVLGKPGVSIMASRGCPYHCAFCCKAVHKGPARFRAVDSVVQEIKEIIEEYGIRTFKFDDDSFTINRKRLYKLCDELEKLDIRFRCHGNARIDTYEDFLKLHKAGCREIIFGVETGSQHVLNLVNKQVTVEQNRQAIINAKKAGLVVRVNLMVGNPGESWKSIKETVDFMWKTKPQLWIVTNFIPLPGCSIWNNPSKYGIEILEHDWKQYFLVAEHNIGGLTHQTENMRMEEIAQARDYLLKNLPPQTGSLEDYHRKLDVPK